jgi:hypothetical protein
MHKNCKKSKFHVYNPVLKLVNETDEEKMYYYTDHFSMSVLDQSAINQVVNLSPIIEIGSGLGYNAYLLHTCGATIESFDNYDWSCIGLEYFFPVKKGTYQQIKNYSTYNLFLSWPPAHTEMAYLSVKNFMKNSLATYFIFIGEYRNTSQALYPYTTGTEKQLKYRIGKLLKVKYLFTKKIIFLKISQRKNQRKL